MDICNFNKLEDLFTKKYIDNFDNSKPINEFNGAINNAPNLYRNRVAKDEKIIPSQNHFKSQVIKS